MPEAGSPIDPFTSDGEMRIAPVGVVVAHRCQARQRVEFGSSFEPCVDASTGRPAPGFQCEETMKIPERERLDGKVEKCGTPSKVGEGQDPVQRPHRDRCGPSVGRHALLQRCQARRGEALRVDVLEDAGVLRERSFARAGFVEDTCHRVGGRE
jgi:hypothetical protein